jgi:hypothetical protein
LASRGKTERGNRAEPDRKRKKERKKERVKEEGKKQGKKEEGIKGGERKRE